MAKKSPIINILTYHLDFKLARQIFTEYESRIKDVKFLITEFKTYKVLAEDFKTVELLLALSIFHKRVIANLDSAIKFYGTVNKLSTGIADTIKMGAYSLDIDEKNKILAVIITYEQLMKKFSISPDVMEYTETNEFLRKVISLKTQLKDATKEKNNTKKENNFEKDDQKQGDDIPF